jgi:CRP-like cAMP-binding protein
MHASFGHARARVQLLREDPELCQALPPEQRPSAIERCVAPAVTIGTGDWRPEELGLDHRGIGALVLDGLLLCRVKLNGRFGAELISPGDLLRPWEGENGSSTLPSTTHWRVILRTRLAILNPAVALQLAHYPALSGILTDRALIRARRLSTMLAIVHQPRIDARLHMLFWHLAGRWGRVRADGVFLPLSLSHNVLADLIVAQRPSVTVSLKKLHERRLIARLDEGWLLFGNPPTELLELETSKID